MTVPPVRLIPSERACVMEGWVRSAPNTDFSMQSTVLSSDVP